MTLPIWTLYDHPSDYPDSFAARKFLLDKATDEVLIAPSLTELRRLLCTNAPGLVCISRSPSDNPNIVESWL